MLGWINQSIEAFITQTFGADKWLEVVAGAEVNPNWVSNCPYSDKITYDLVVTAAGLLGVSVNDALEAYGNYFIQHVQGQGYTKLLSVLGSNVAEFLQNLNNLHLHLVYCWPDMVPPAFRCEQVTPESLLLHYYSPRPGLWPIVVGVLKGIASNYFSLQLQVELLHSREKGDSDHEVFKLSYPYQEDLRNFGGNSAAAHSSIFAMSAAQFFTLHSFHLVMDEQLQLLQWGEALGRVLPELQRGQHVRAFFRCKHPGHLQLDYQQIRLHTNNTFVLQARSSMLSLKGQMLPTTVQLPGSAPDAPPTPVLVFLASPRVRSLLEMQQSSIYLSDIPLHDMTSDYILLAEQRHAEADLKEKYEKLTVELKAANDKLARTTAYLEEEKARAEALLYRMSGLIACFPCGPGEKDPQQLAAMAECQSQAAQLVGQSSNASVSTTSALDRIEAVRQELARANLSSSEQNQVQCLELLGEGTYGKVYKALWKGSIVAVKTIVLPSAMSGQEKREKMAIMEAAISSALSHPNIMQTYTYDIKPIKDNIRGSEDKLLLIGGSTASTNSSTGGGGMSGSDQGSNVHSYEVRLICEYCDKGSLREALDLGAFKLPDGGLNYPAVLDTAVEIVTAVLHLHQCNVLHSDLKARNIMLKSSGSEGRGVTAKVADFGLAVKMDHMETHLSNAFQGTMTHMAPEIMIKGRISKAADVYALGMVLWELYTAKHVFRGIPRALLGHQITLLHKRPEFPADAHEEYVRLTQQCWDPSPAKRPTLEVLLGKLQAARAALRCATQPLASYDIEGHLTRKHSTLRESRGPKPASRTHQQQQQGDRGLRRASDMTAQAAAAFHAAVAGSKPGAAAAASPGLLNPALRQQELRRLEQQRQRAAARTVSGSPPHSSSSNRGKPLHSVKSDVAAAAGSGLPLNAQQQQQQYCPNSPSTVGTGPGSLSRTGGGGGSSSIPYSEEDEEFATPDGSSRSAAGVAGAPVAGACDAAAAAGMQQGVDAKDDNGAAAGPSTGTTASMPRSVSWDLSNALLDEATAVAAAQAAPAGVTVGNSSGSLLGHEEPSIYLEQTMSTADTGQHWQGVLQLQEVSFDSMMPPEGAAGEWHQRTTMQQLLAAHQGAAAAAGGAAAGQCPFGHGRAAAAAAAAAAGAAASASASGSSVSLNGVSNH